MSEDRILAALEALKEADEGQAAATDVEARVIDAFRKRRRRRVRNRAAAWTAAVAAVAGVVAVEETRPRPLPELIRVERVPVVSQPEPVVVPAKPVRPAPRRRPAPVREIATQFFPLMDVQPPFERGELVRVTVPASTMRAVGLPVFEDHLSDLVEADVLVGQEGLARAIRFVSLQR